VFATTFEKEEKRVKNKTILVLVLLFVVFLAGFVPTYVKAHRLENELREARREQNLAQLRDLASLAYFQANQKDYGLAAGTATRFFDRTQEAANQAPDISAKKPLEDLLSLRDPITAGLAKGDPGVLSDLQALFAKTRQATAIPSGASKSE
jgi:flagellar basal body-associated protein FliL